jgi:hypothetical protein
MSVFSFETPSSVFGSRSSLVQRILATWRAMRSERLLTSLPYDTLKDIGFPAANDPRTTPDA